MSHGLPSPGKETPISVQSHDLLDLGGEFSGLVVTDKPSRESARSPLFQKPITPNGSPSPMLNRAQAKIICPWWLTEGYSCREQHKGKYPMVHEDIPEGIKDPLICHFWADGHRCTKSETTCRFAHYPAQHRLVAPMPGKKKSKKSKTIQNEWSEPSPSTDTNDEKGFWRRQSHPRPPEEWAATY
ncbi:hypothetical protein M426DRAFT_79406 [Hypoxylon sp. CI-4A]|nr:hypothetical protein M426DRAFT_79406 [Hypoxylon sp. CI-4A]